MVFIFSLALGCSSPSVETTEILEHGPLNVWALSLPVHFLAKEIGAEDIQLRLLLPFGQDASSWAPSADEIYTISQSDLILANGAAFESWVGTASIPSGLLVESLVDFSPIYLEGKTHSHGQSGGNSQATEHSHSEMDPHAWSDPEIFSLQAQRVYETLSHRDPEHKERYAQRLEDLQSELKILVEETEKTLESLDKVQFAANHPAYNYFARRFGLEILNFDFDPQMPPSTLALDQFEEWRKGTDNPVLLWEELPSIEIQGLFPNVRHHLFDPLEQGSEDNTYDYLVQYRSNISSLSDLSAPLSEDSNAQ